MPDKKIQLLERKDIDTYKWNEVVANALDGRIYTQSNWLDIVNPGWKALVYGDYECIMPLPVKTKYHISYLSQPPFTQQFGLLTQTIIDELRIKQFINKATTYFRYAKMGMNIDCRNFNHINTRTRKNYILPLNNSYLNIAKSYSKKLHQNINKAKRAGLCYTTSNNFSKIIAAFKNRYDAKINLGNEQYNKLIALTETFYQSGHCFSKEINLNGETLSSGIFFTDGKRIYKTITVTNNSGRHHKAHHFMLDGVINEFAESILILDFEGSDIAGIEHFNQQFGAVLEPYFFIQWNRLPWPLNKLNR